MEEPKIEDVLRNIHDLYVNPDTVAKEKASKWLEQFQKSVSAQGFVIIFPLIPIFLDLLVEVGRSIVAAKERPALMLLRRSNNEDKDSALVS